MTNLLNTEQPILELVRQLTLTSISETQKLLEDPQLKATAHKYIQHRDRNFDVGLNLFTIISDHYRKENFHSDILKLLLDPKAIHQEGTRFFNLFLDYLNNHVHGIEIDKRNYQNVTVEREKDKIDISIKDHLSKRAIIIENKINNAPDMDRQLPRYCEILENAGFRVDAVVYLILSGNKSPSTIGWKPEERDRILDKIISIAAYNETNIDLYNGWLKKCESTVTNIDTLFLIRHYNKLLYTLGGKNMNKPLMEAFMQKMMANDNYGTAYALKDMLDSLIFYRRDKIIDHFKFKSRPFAKVGDWNHYAVLNEYISGDSFFAIDVIVTKNLYQIQFFDRHYNGETEGESKVNPALVILENLKMEDQFFRADSRYEIQFTFPDKEDEMYTFLDNFVEAIRINDKK